MKRLALLMLCASAAPSYAVAAEWSEYKCAFTVSCDLSTTCTSINSEFTITPLGEDGARLWLETGGIIDMTSASSHATGRHDWYVDKLDAGYSAIVTIYPDAKIVLSEHSQSKDGEAQTSVLTGRCTEATQ